MSSSKKKPILITGSHRSGSTWVGKMIAFSPPIGYIREPFNPKSGICKTKFKYWFTYICEKNESLYRNEIKDCLDFKYRISKEAKASNSLKDVGRLLRDKIKFTAYKMQKKRPLVKDPISLFSAEWLANRFKMDVIILIRHPAAFAGSLKKANWTYPFSHLLQQPLLMQDHLRSYESEIQNYASGDKDIVDQSILLWNVIHHMILKYFEKNKHDWIFVRHEDLSRSPLEEFGKIYSKLELIYSTYVQQKIAEFSFADNSEKNKLKRDSKSNIWSWKNRLTEEEIYRVKEGTHTIASKFYTEEDWLI